MDDNAPKENPPTDFNKLDLSQLQGFSFGTQWTQDKGGSPDRGERGAGGERARYDDRREGGGGADRRDRRVMRRPAGTGGAEGGGAAGPGAPHPGDAGRRGPGGDRRPSPGGGGDYRGGPRREGGYAGGGGDRGARQGQGYGGRGGPMDRGPYESPYYTATFYPEDTSFNTLVQTIRKSCRTVELFEIARTVVAKNDRFVVVVAHRPDHRAAAAPTPDGTEAPKAAKRLFHVSVPDGLPFESDEAAVGHVLGNHLDKFFDSADVEVDPPKGNFQVINRCGLTGELLGPPNYHRYNQIVQQHYAAKIGSRMGLEAFRSRIETVRDPEVVNQWLAKMKKATRYTWKLGVVAAPIIASPEAEVPVENEPQPPETEAVADEGAPVTPLPSVVPNFDTLEDARVFLLSQARDKVVRTTETARFHGKLLETMPEGEIRMAVEGALERQRRFPLDTANALRGRLRREHFTIFKKGSKGVSYVCAVKRKFRVPGQTFADSIGALISFVEANPMVRASELASKMLGLSLTPPAPVAPATEAPVVEAPAGETTPSAPAAVPTPPVEAGPSIEDRARLARLQGDLMWLVREGYVTEFIDGRLFAPPPMVEARKKEIETEEHDPENFPDAPAPSAAPAAEPESSAPAEPAEEAAEPTPNSEVAAPAPAEEPPPAATAFVTETEAASVSPEVPAAPAERAAVPVQSESSVPDVPLAPPAPAAPTPETKPEPPVAGS